MAGTLKYTVRVAERADISRTKGKGGGLMRGLDVIM